MEITLIISAIGLGFASGFHCIGMCGPIAISMGLTKNQKANFYLQNLTYNSEGFSLTHFWELYLALLVKVLNLRDSRDT